MKVPLEHFLDDDDSEEFQEPEQKFNLRKPIRPYLCSTPGDFKEEKDFLVKNVFPEINELCHLRGGHFFPVDIRWDVDGDEVTTGQLLRLNLDYICKCSPFFICLLGESYGPYRELDSPPLPTRYKTVDPEASWIDKNYLLAALSGYTWVLKESNQNTSLTELEIIQAAFLNNNKHCHFYFRQPEHLDVKYGHLSETDREQLSQVHLPENEYADLSIRDLKQRIVKKALPVKYFRTFEELGKYVLKDWKGVIDIVYPPMEHPLSILESEEYREWMANEVFAESRRQVFIRSSDISTILDELNQFASSVLDEVLFEQEEKIIERPYSITNILRKKKPVEALYKSLMLIHGDRGSGKSTIVSNWLHRFMIENRDVKVLSHFVGCSGRSTDISIFLRRCIKELREEYLRPDCSVEVPNFTNEDQPWSFQEVCEAFVAALSLGPTVIVLDGLDELGGTLGMTIRQVKEFKWLPLPLPPQCRIILTTCRSDLSFHALSSRSDTKLMNVPSFSTEKLRTEFLDEVMQQQFQHLTQEHYQLVTDIKLATKPLFLSILATEMKSYSVYTNLTEFLDEIYEKISSLRDLCVRSFQRWTKDFSWTKESLYGEVEEEDHLELEGWVPDTLRFLSVSRTGLTQFEIFELLKNIGYKNLREVKNFDWLQFRTCVGNLVYEKPSGLMDYSHQHLKEVVEYVLLRGATRKDAYRRRKQYNSLKPGNSEVITASNEEKEWKEQKKKFHHNLAKYFLQQPYSQRLLEELPWHLLMSGDISMLVTVLTDPVMIEGFLDESKDNPSNKLDLAYYWSSIKTADGRDPATVYEKLLSDLGIMEAQVCNDDEDEDVQASGENSQRNIFSSPDPPEEKKSGETLSVVIPTIITSPPSRTRELSAVSEESLSGESDPDQTVQDTAQLSQIDEKLDDVVSESDVPQMEVNGENIEMDTDKDIDTKDTQNRCDVDTVFLTETKSDSSSSKTKSADLSKTCNPVQIAWLLLQFLKDIGYSDSTHSILQALSNKLVMSYPLEHGDMLIHAKVQEMLGKYSQKSGDIEQTEKWFRKSLRTVMDLSELDDDSPYYIEMQNLKGRLLSHHGFLRMNEGLTESAEDLLKEGLECAIECGNLTAKANILYNLGLLRMQQNDFIMAESSLRQALTIREQWFGRSHPLVADVLFSIAGIMGNPSNDRGFNKVTAEHVYRRVLKIREDCQGKDHLSVAEVLFELGKLLKDSDHSALCEAVDLVRRALDIRTTKLGGEHIDTRAVRQYLNNLEISLKMGRYEFGPAKRTETRTLERPYSNLSWREKDLVNFERKAKSRQSRSTGSILSRPSSYKDDFYGQSMSRHSSMSHVSASEKLMMETERPRLLHRENLVNRKLKPSPPSSDSVYFPRKQVTLEINLGGNETDRSELVETRVADPQIDSFGTEIPETEPSSTGVEVKKASFAENPESCPIKLFKRFNSAGSSRSGVSQQNERNLIRGNSARSYGSSRITGFSYVSRSSVRSSQSRRTAPGPHAITLGNSHSVTTGPNCTLESLLGAPKSPRDVHRNIHHKSAWYHVPGRYSTPDKPFPPKRSQKTKEAKILESRISTPSKSNVNTYYKKPQKINRSPAQPLPMQYIPSNEFGMTVKGIGPVLSNGYYSNNPNDYAMNGYDVGDEIEADHHVGSTVKFKEAVFVE